MKKKILMFVLMVCLIIPCGFIFSACNKNQTDNVQVRVGNEYIEWSNNGTEWNNVISIDDIKDMLKNDEDFKGDKGDSGNDGIDAIIWTIGNDGYWYRDGVKTQILARATNGENGNGIKSITKDTTNSTSQKSIYIIELDNGDKFPFEVVNGIDGKDLNREKYTVTFNYNNPLTSIEDDIKNYAKNAVDSLELSHGSWCGNSFPNYDGTVFEDSFKGWFIEGTNIEVNKYDNIGGDITLEAKWENVNLQIENCTYASGYMINNGYMFSIDLEQDNIIVPDYYKAEGNGLKKVTAIKRLQNYVNGTEYQLKTIKLPAFLVKFWQPNVAYPDGIFEGCVNLKTIDIPDTVTTLGKNAFEKCKSLENIKLPSSMTTLPSYVFYQCTNLKSIELPDKLTTIENGAFAECENLKILNIPEGVTNIGREVFRTCTNLKTIYLPKTLETIQSSFNVENLYYNGTIEDWLNLTIYDYYGQLSLFGDKTCFYVNDSYGKMYEVTEVVVPDTITEIKENAFNGYNRLTKLTFSNSVESIGTYAFNECRNLLYVDLGNNVTDIDDYAFSTCTQLETVIIPTTIEHIGEGALGLVNTNIYYKGTEEQWNEINKESYWGVFAGIRIYYYLETEPTSGGFFWHYKNNNLTVWTTVNIPNGTTVISEGAFSGCQHLTNINIPNSVITIEDYAFNGCAGLTNINIPYGVTSIGYLAFGGCTNLINITIPLSVKVINQSAFSGCTGLTKISIPQSLRTISYGTFKDCISLTSVEIPEGVTDIDNEAFAGCTNLRSISIPSSVTEICDPYVGGFRIFDGCTSLVNITVDENNTQFKSIDGNLYTKDGKTLLQYAIGKSSSHFEISEDVTEIESYAFCNCTNLISVIIPNSVKNIGYGAFLNCTNLFKIFYNGSVSEWNKVNAGTYKTALTNKVVYYSETKPTLNIKKYWHYVDNIPTIWTEED